MDFKGKKALVCGMAKSGISAAELLNKLGADVTLQDKKERTDLGDLSYIENQGIKLYCGKNPDEIVTDFDFLVVSPGIPSSLEFFNVSATNGKTTTTAITGEIIKKKFPSAAVVGNIGVPYSSMVQDLTEKDYVVAEISSFQMERANEFHPHISAVLNITPDHLDRHKTLETYIEMKERVFKKQTESDYCILNWCDETTRKMAEKTAAKVFFFSSGEKLDEGIYMDGDDIFVKWQGIDEKLINIHDLKLLGTHNYENVMAASAMGICAGVSLEDIREVLKGFAGVEHRIEFVKTVDGVDYYNDSKGTNTDAAIRGIMAMVKPCVLIGGGYDKGSEYDDWVEKFEGRVKKLVLIGKTAEKIALCCDKHGFKDYVFADTFEEAVNICRETAKSGDCVLLSPACASWDMFKSYEQRGEIFKEMVRSF